MGARDGLSQGRLEPAPAGGVELVDQGAGVDVCHSLPSFVMSPPASGGRKPPEETELAFSGGLRPPLAGGDMAICIDPGQFDGVEDWIIGVAVARLAR